MAGGVLLGRKALQRDRRVLGVPVPSKVDLSGLGQSLGEAGKGLSQSIGEAGRQFGRLAGEVQSVREKAEQIGKLLT